MNHSISFLSRSISRDRNTGATLAYGLIGLRSHLDAFPTPQPNSALIIKRFASGQAIKSAILKGQRSATHRRKQHMKKKVPSVTQGGGRVYERV